LAQDVVVTGHDRESVGLLVFPGPGARALAGAPTAAQTKELMTHPAVLGHLRAGLRRLAEVGAGSSTCAARALLLEEPPSIDAGEITDKGYINQRAVLDRRSALVESLYAEPLPPWVVAL
jgi:feruloyl-CoA synthase